jgi:hypothetical protein
MPRGFEGRTREDGKKEVMTIVREVKIDKNGNRSETVKENITFV